MPLARSCLIYIYIFLYRLFCRKRVTNKDIYILGVFDHVKYFGKIVVCKEKLVTDFRVIVNTNKNNSGLSILCILYIYKLSIYNSSHRKISMKYLLVLECIIVGIDLSDRHIAYTKFL